MYHRKKTYGFGKYTWQQITAMIAGGYIPVANATELNGIRNTTPKVMGLGTIWEDTYVTGLDKKYVQVNNIDLSNIANWANVGLTGGEFAGTYDGNMLTISNMTKSTASLTTHTGFFGVILSAVICNVVLKKASLQSSNQNTDHVGFIAQSNDSLIYNVYIIDSVFNASSARNGVGALLGYCQNNNTIYNCNAINCTVNVAGGSLQYQGGLIGLCGANNTIDKCDANVDVFTNIGGTFTNRCLGGLVGYIQTSSISYFTNCYSVGSVQQNLGSDTGGFVGWNRGGSVFVNCYATGSIVGGTNKGGFCGRNSGTITNSYYDKDTSGMTDTGKGLPRTTIQMQQGTADSTINGEAMYTGWDDAIWNFRTNTKYPKLKKI